MKCYCGTIITVNANDDVVRYLVEDKEKSSMLEMNCQSSIRTRK